MQIPPQNELYYGIGEKSEFITKCAVPSEIKPRNLDLSARGFSVVLIFLLAEKK